MKRSKFVTIITYSILAVLLILTAGYSGVALAAAESEYSDPDTPIEVDVGQKFVVALESNASTGYQWQFADRLTGKGVLKVVKRQYHPPASNHIGAPGKELWTFKAVGEGETIILMGYVHSWDMYTPPAAIAAFTITVS